MDAVSIEDAWHLAKRLAMKFRLGTGWNVQCDLILSIHPEYARESHFWPDPISYAIDQERRARFLTENVEAATRLSKYFLTLSYEADVRSGNKAASWVFSSDDGQRDGPGDKALQQFEKKVAEVDNLLRSNLLNVEKLEGSVRVVGGTEQLFDGVLRFVRRCIAGEDCPFGVPDCPMYLNQYLATDDFTGGAEPMLGIRHIRVVAIDGFPERSFAGILRELDSLPFDFRYCQQASVLDEQEAKEEHGVNRSKWGFKKDPKQYNPIKNGVRRVDPFAAQMEADAALAESAAEHGKEIFVRFSAKVVLMESDPECLSLRSTLSSGQ